MAKSIDGSCYFTDQNPLPKGRAGILDHLHKDTLFCTALLGHFGMVTHCLELLSLTETLPCGYWQFSWACSSTAPGVPPYFVS